MIEEKELLKKLITFRRELHQIPELGFNTVKTKLYIIEKLKNLNCTVSPLLENGLTAYFDMGKAETIAFRCDMDGLPIEETNDFSFVSTHEKCSHSCGHDGHMTNMLGFALVLNNYIKEGIEFKNNILIIFQPAEETIVGAKAICDTDIFSRYNVSSIYGLHLWPGLETGEIYTKEGPMMAHSTEVNIDFYGKSAHCGKPAEGHDALLSASEFLTKIYQYKENNIQEPSILKFGKLHSGNVRNAISPYSRLEGTMRTFSLETRVNIETALKNISDDINSKYDVSVKIDTEIYHPAVINDNNLLNNAKEKNSSIKILDEPVFIAEDFSFYQERIPGLFFFLGTGMNIPLHSTNFNFNEEALLQGVKLFLSLIE